MNQDPLQRDGRRPASRTETRWGALMLLCLAFLALVVYLRLPRIGSGAGHPMSPRAMARSTIADFGVALDAFKNDTGYFPSGTNGLNSLIENPPGATNWRGPYLPDRVPLDPWGHAYIYICPGKRHPESYDLISTGPDGRLGGGGDLCN